MLVAAGAELTVAEAALDALVETATGTSLVAAELTTAGADELGVDELLVVALAESNDKEPPGLMMMTMGPVGAVVEGSCSLLVEDELLDDGELLDEGELLEAEGATLVVLGCTTGGTETADDEEATGTEDAELEGTGTCDEAGLDDEAGRGAASDEPGSDGTFPAGEVTSGLEPAGAMTAGADELARTGGTATTLASASGERTALDAGIVEVELVDWLGVTSVGASVVAAASWPPVAPIGAACEVEP